VLFGWLATQPFFRDLTNVDVRKRLYEEEMRAIEQQLVAPIFSTYEQEFEDKYGVIDRQLTKMGNEVWFVVNPRDE
jgi:hypothetical protein